MQIVSRPGHPLQGAQALSLKDIAAYPLSLPEIPSDLQAQIAAMGGASEEPLCTTLTTDQYDMIMDVVQNGNMLTCAPRHLLRPYVEDGRLRVLSQNALQPVWRASAAYRPVSVLSPAFSALLEMIQSWFAQQT